MQSQKRDRLCQLLELSPGASPEEIRQAYLQLLLRYGAGCLPSYGLFRVSARQTFLAGLKSAHDELLRDASAPPNPSDGGGGTQEPDPDGQPLQTQSGDQGADADTAAGEIVQAVATGGRATHKASARLATQVPPCPRQSTSNVQRVTVSALAERLREAYGDPSKPPR